MNGWTKTLEKSGNFRDIKLKCNILRQTCVKHMLKRKLDWPKIIIVHIEFYDLPKSKPILQMLVTNFFTTKSMLEWYFRIYLFMVITEQLKKKLIWKSSTFSKSAWNLMLITCENTTLTYKLYVDYRFIPETGEKSHN